MPKNNRECNTKPENANRRVVGKNVLLGGGLLGATIAQNNWVKPVVNSALLPAHAEPSRITCPSTPVCVDPG